MTILTSSTLSSLPSLAAAALVLLTSAGLSAAASSPEAAPDVKPAEMLVETAWLADHLKDPNLRIVDLRPRIAYDQGHIPGAVHLDFQKLRGTEDTLTYLPTPDTLKAMLRGAGVGSTTRVVAYDDSGNLHAARLWYVAGAYGFGKVSMLNGSWFRWSAESKPVSTAAEPARSGDFEPRREPAFGCTRPEVLARTKDVVVIDTRSAAEYRGETPGGASKAGRIPGAIHIEWRETLTAERTFKPDPEIRKILTDQGVTPDREIVTYCTVGWRASHVLFTLKRLGYPRVRVYYGSMADYTQHADAPLEK